MQTYLLRPPPPIERLLPPPIERLLPLPIERLLPLPIERLLPPCWMLRSLLVFEGEPNVRSRAGREVLTVVFCLFSFRDGRLVLVLLLRWSFRF